MKITKFACSVLCVAMGVARAEQSFELVGEKGSATVVVPAKAELSTGLAVSEFTNYVSKITGVTLLVENWSSGEVGKSLPLHHPAVVIGTLKTLGADVPVEAKAALGKTDNMEAAWTGVKGNVLWIVGKDQVAELYATYHFLESQLGVRWFKAATKEDPGDYYPTFKTISIAPFVELREPRFRIRRLDKCGAAGSVIAYNAETAAVRNGYQVFPGYGGQVPYDKPDSAFCRFYGPRCPHRSQNLGGGHTTFSRPMPAKTCFEKHPEYFAEVDGKRVRGEQYCFSNPEVQKNTADEVIGLLDKYDGDGQYLFGMVDVTHGWCECVNCRALDPVPAKAKGTPNVSTRFGIAVKHMADRIWSKWPKADLRLWAYHTYRELPIGVRQDPRMMIQFCDHGRCYGHHFDDPKCRRNADMLALMKGWLKVTPRLYTYEYFNCSHSYYVCHEKDEAHDLRFYASLGVVGWKNEASFSDSYFVPEKPKGQYEDRKDAFPSNWQWLYTTGKLLWNPDLDEDAIIADAEAKYYGVAYPVMKKYHAYRRKLWAENPNCLGYPTGDQRLPTLLDVPGAREQLLGFLAEAEKLVQVESPSPRKDDHHSSTSTSNFDSRLIRHRISLDRNWLTRYWIAPNERIKAKAGQSYKAMRREGTVVVDGDGEDAAWAKAVPVTAFKKSYGDGTALPPELATSVSVLHDDEAFYFLVKAKEPDMAAVKPSRTGNAWDGDGMELFLFPPAIDNRNYHLAVSPVGVVSAATHPGGSVADAFGATAKGVLGKDGWTVEIRVPVAKIHPLVPGETWKVNFARNRTHLEESHFSTDGAYFDTPNYHPLAIER